LTVVSDAATLRVGGAMSLRKRARRRLLPLYQTTVRKLHDLNYVFLELTHRCNLSCLHCGSDCTRDTTTPDLPFDDIVRVMEETRTAYDPHHIAVVLSGGEPLCYPRVFELGERLTRMEFPWGMVTNGHAWNDRTFELAKRARMASVTVSLDGLEEEHEWLRGRPRSFARAIRTIGRFVEDPFWQAMDVVTCVNQRNLPHLDEIYALLREIGVPGWRLFTISPIGRATQLPELFLEPPQYQELMRKILEYRQRDGMTVALSESGYLGPCLEGRVRDADHFCLAGIRVAGIMVDGAILACPNIDRRFRQGNIYEDSFVEVWENRYQAFRDRSWMRAGPCVGCSEWGLCQGNSFHLWDRDRHQTRLCHFHDHQLGEFQE
jgi:radical SAM protein with 4Fe4S-binding SPASM domain